MKRYSTSAQVPEPKSAAASKTARCPVVTGYADPHAFLAEYLRPDRDPAASTPTLSVSLQRVKSSHLATQWLRSLPVSAVCVIEGFSAPGNERALAAFLSSLGIEAPRMKAFDLIDVPAAWRRYGIPHPEIDFRVADASNLAIEFADSCCDLFVQDHLLNCAPHALHANILREANRILKPEGLGLIHVTDDSALSTLTGLTESELESRFAVKLDPLAYGLAGNGLPEGARADLKAAIEGCYFTRDNGRESVLIIPANGDFEFYRPAEDWPTLIEQAGLRLLSHVTHCGPDSNGNFCRRHYMVVGKP